ncbi:molybdenum cofactor biosynthesis protein MoaE [Bacteroidota bacterium]
MDSKFLVDGSIDPEIVSKSISSHSEKLNIGAHSIFLGQVRDDVIHGRKVVAIDYSCYTEMADKQFQKIKDQIFNKYDDLTCMHIKHGLGKVGAGEISLFVFVSSGHRVQAFKACEETVNLIKDEVPIWGKEIFDDESYVWKENK